MILKLSLDLVRHVIEKRFTYKRYKGYLTYAKLMRYYDKLLDRSSSIPRRGKK